MKKTKRKPALRRGLGIWILIMVGFMAELLFYTWCRVQCRQVGYETASAAHHQEELFKLQNRLKIELARLKSPERISNIAREQLGLMTPDSGHVITIP